MQRKHRLLSLLLAAAMLFSMAVPAMAASTFEGFLQSTGRLKYIDYTRVKQNTKQVIKVTFQIGSKEFRGRIEKGYSLDNKTTDKLIRQAMLEEGLTDAQILIHEVNIRQAEKLDPTFRVGFWIEMIGQLLHMGRAVSIGQAYLDNKGGTEFLMETLRSESTGFIAGQAISGMALSANGAFVVTSLFNCTERLAKETYQAIRNSEIKQRALDSGLALALLYDRINRRLRERANVIDDTTWHLKADAPAKEKIDFFGAEVTQIWRLTADLQPKQASSSEQEGAVAELAPAEGGSGRSSMGIDMDIQSAVISAEAAIREQENQMGPIGTFTGPVTIEITHDLKNFDKEFLWTVAEHSAKPLVKLRSMLVGQHIYDTWQTNSSLTKTLRNANAELDLSYIDPTRSGEVFAKLSLDGFEEKQSFLMWHPIRVVPDGLFPNMDKEGHYSFPYYTGHLSTSWTFQGEMLPDGMTAAFGTTGYDMEAWGKTAGLPVSAGFDQSQSVQEQVTYWYFDGRMYKDLEPGEIVISTGWKEASI